MTLAEVPLLRIVRTRGTWLALLGWSAVALIAAWEQHSHDALHGADRALDVYATLALPLLVYAIVGSGVGGRGLAGSGRSLVRIGASPGAVAATTVVVTALLSALVTGLLGALVAAAAHGADDPPVTLDALHALSAGALAGTAYAAYLMLGAAIVGGPWGRAILLTVDWAVGSGAGLGALFLPRAHLRNLLGGEAPFDAVAWESQAALAVIAIVCTVLAVKLAARARA